MKRQPVLVVALLIVAIAATATAVGAVAWALRDNNDAPTRMGPAMMATDSRDTPGWWDGSWRSMMGMMGWASAASEPEYLAEMIAHHQEAVAAAGELARSDRADMRSFGEAIVASQSAQIRQMQAWIEEWYPNQPTDVAYQPMMRNLSGLSGDPLDRAFLQDMIGHHMVAVMMSQNLLWRGAEHDQVAELARSIRDDQHAEIVQMQRWLAQWFDTDWRGGMGWHGPRHDVGTWALKAHPRSGWQVRATRGTRRRSVAAPRSSTAPHPPLAGSLSLDVSPAHDANIAIWR